MNRLFVVQSLLDKLGRNVYLEIGVHKRLVYKRVKAKLKMGVDPYYHTFKNPWLKRIPPAYVRRLRALSGEVFFEMTSDQFFHTQKDFLSAHPVDVCFIDGLHTFEAAYKDVNNALNHLSPKGVIVMHDCSPTSAAMAYPAPSIDDAKKQNLPGWTGAWCGDVWKAVALLRAERNDLDIFTLDTDCGLGILRRGKTETGLKLSHDDLTRMTFEDLEKNRLNLLNLKPADYFFHYLKEAHS